MALSSRVKTRLVDTINVAFAGIGNTNDTKSPKTASNTTALVWEYWIANHLATLANRRKIEAEKAVIKNGIIFDKEIDPRPAGTDETLYTDDFLSIHVNVRQPSTRVDVQALVTFLRSKGVKANVLSQAVDHATVENRPAHTFTVSLITNGQG